MFFIFLSRRRNEYLRNRFVAPIRHAQRVGGRTAILSAKAATRFVRKGLEAPDPAR
jgi:hypothetical protein